jgi:hypothetical protein
VPSVTSLDEITAQRLTAQLLAGPPVGDAVTVVERLLAVQAQDQRGARLAIRARSAGLTSADVDRALTDERTLVITWLNRGTLHLVRSEDYPWLQALTTPPIVSGNARRLGQEGVSGSAAERGVELIERSLAADGPLTRSQLRERLDSAGVPTKGQAFVHLLLLTCLRGLAVRGPIVGGDQAYVLVRDWLGEPRPVDRERALGELAPRFLAGHGPASDRDLAKWAGLPLRDARAALRAVASRLDVRPDGLVDLIGAPAAAPLPPPRLLGAFDPVLHGWVSREPLLQPHQPVITVNGLFRPFALVAGRAAGLWTIRGGEVVLEPFAPLAPKDAAALRLDADDVARFLAGSRETRREG